jgi:hypothetical protein
MVRLTGGGDRGCRAPVSTALISAHAVSARRLCQRPVRPTGRPSRWRKRPLPGTVGCRERTVRGSRWCREGSRAERRVVRARRRAVRQGLRVTQRRRRVLRARWLVLRAARPGRQPAAGFVGGRPRVPRARLLVMQAWLAFDHGQRRVVRGTGGARQRARDPPPRDHHLLQPARDTLRAGIRPAQSGRRITRRRSPPLHQPLLVQHTRADIVRARRSHRCARSGTPLASRPPRPAAGRESRRSDLVPHSPSGARLAIVSPMSCDLSVTSVYRLDLAAA